MNTHNGTFESELSTQRSLRSYLFVRALKALEKGDIDSFRYASEIHDETEVRVQDLEAARASMQSAFAEREPDMQPYRVLGALALGGMALSSALHLGAGQRA